MFQFLKKLFKRKKVGTLGDLRVWELEVLFAQLNYLETVWHLYTVRRRSRKIPHPYQLSFQPPRYLRVYRENQRHPLLKKYFYLTRDKKLLVMLRRERVQKALDYVKTKEVL